MTVFEFEALHLERAAKCLAHWLETTKPDMLTWKPTLDNQTQGRSILEQMDEVIGVNMGMAAMLAGAPAVPPAPAQDAPAATLESTKERLLESARVLADAYRKLDDSVFEREFTLPFGKIKGDTLLALPLQNMNYHGGQVNLIQILSGDMEFHATPDFLSV